MFFRILKRIVTGIVTGLVFIVLLSLYINEYQLPKIQYTTREVISGIQFIAFAQDKFETEPI